MLVNQRIDLVQEIWTSCGSSIGLRTKLPGLCTTSIQYDKYTKAANLCKSLSQFILQNWTSEFELTLRDLRTAIIQRDFHLGSPRPSLTSKSGWE